MHDTDDKLAATSNARVEKLAETVTPNYSKLTTAKLAKELGLKTQELNDKLLEVGYLADKEGELVLTDTGSKAGGITKRGKFGDFCLWDSGMVI